MSNGIEDPVEADPLDQGLTVAAKLDPYRGNLGSNLRVWFLVLLHLHTKATHKQYLHKMAISSFWLEKG